MLPKFNRLTKQADFKEVARKSKPVHSKFLFLKKIDSSNKNSQFGIIISAKVSKKAVVRNKLKRQISEIIRLNLDKIKSGFKVIIVVKNSLVGKDYKDIEQDLFNLFKKAKLR